MSGMGVTILALAAVAVTERACDDAAEKRLSALEKRVEALEQARAEAAVADDRRAQDFTTCMDLVEDNYWGYVKLNGHKKPGSDIWTATVAVWDTAAKNKANAIEKCKARYR